ncbi:Acyl-CoA reductase [Novosphingobium sp. CF614]|uniref:aldehyde dehydrogenase n=1 Tax=Novosphingobium sp. CF614 TaxID=1884364 RepID=UPI0008E682A0|nr:aldehyde dehydrogenase [Novosphingobium sp. CF614]SFF82848.1 Acyl-CoA reductase [Novosphingobium sp. CF614]
MDTATAPIAHPDRFFVGGEWIAPSTAKTIDVLNSGTENLFVKVAEAQEKDVERTVAAAREAFDNGPWPRLTHAERADYLRALADAIEVRAEATALTWTVESGFLHSHATMAGRHGGATYRWYADLAETYPFVQEHPTKAAKVALLVREPVGVVAAIIPWNGPPSTIAYKIAPALLAGCTVIVKPAPEAPSAAYILAEACEEIGLPPGVVNFITAEREVSEMLVRHPGVDKVTFTGSTAAGKRIGAACGERIARCTLELGGKSAAVILDDYDVETAARTIARLAPVMAGQVCSSLTRIVVTRDRHDRLVEALAQSFGATRVGDPFDGESQMGPLAMARQRDRVEGYIAKGKSEGATLATGGGRPKHMNRGYYIEPTVFGNVDNHSTIAREEIFGPVLSVIPADSEAQAIAIANDTIYGLNASVFTNDVDRAYAASRALRTGNVGHNALRWDQNIVFGGFKQSGIGREGGVEGLLPFLEAKLVLLDGMPSKLQA